MPAIIVFLLIALVFCVYQWNRTDLAYDRLESKYERDIKLMNDRCTEQSALHVHAVKRNVEDNQRLRVERDALKREMDRLMGWDKDPVILSIGSIREIIGPIEPEAKLLLELAQEAQRTGTMPDLSPLASHSDPISG
ncbi:MAG: hypothetical protein V4662_12035 [Verrucomicrobiota bacterium]